MIEVNKIVAGYGKIQVIDNISLKLNRGRIIAVIGPNGSGKSTLLKSVSGIIKPFSGEVFIDKMLQSEMSRKDIAKKIAYLSQEKQVPEMTVEQFVIHGRFPYLSFPGKYSRKDRELATSVMTSVGVIGYKDALLSSLSGGIRQKVYLAMAICQAADYIFLDEPTTFLDIYNSYALLETLKRLSKEDKGIVMVIHDLIHALEYSDEIVVMDKGKIVMIGSPDEVFNSDIINKIFKVRINRFETEKGYAYSYEKNYDRCIE